MSPLDDEEERTVAERSPRDVKRFSRFLVALVALLTVTAVVPGPALAGGGAAGGAVGAAATTTAAGSPPGGTPLDTTVNLSYTVDNRVEVADVGYNDPGTFSAVTVDLAGGTLGNVSPGVVHSVAVYAINDSEGASVAEDSAPYDAHGTTVHVRETDYLIDRVRIVAVVGQVDDGARIDAEFDFGTNLSGGGYDTEGVQTAVVDDRGFVRGRVTNDRGFNVEDARVEVVNVESESVVGVRHTGEDGEFPPLPVAPNQTYTAVVQKFGYGTTIFSERVFVEPRETRKIAVVLDVRATVDSLRIATIDLGDLSTDNDDRLTNEPVVLYADGRSSNKVLLAVVAENTSLSRGRGDVGSFFDANVTVSFADETGPGDFLDNGQIDREIVVVTETEEDIDGDGLIEAYGTFAITADNADSSTVAGAVAGETVVAEYVNAVGEKIVARGIEGGTTDYFRPSVRFENQTTRGDSVVVASASLPSAGFVVIQDGDEVLGKAGLKPRGDYENLTVSLDRNVTENTTLRAVVYDDNHDGVFDVRDTARASDDARITLVRPDGDDGEGDGDGDDGDGDGGPPALDPDGDGNVSTDGTPAGDGLHQDVDGDGDVDVFDVQAFYDDVAGDGADVTAGNVLYDFDGDGDVDIFDVRTLFDRVTG